MFFLGKTAIGDSFSPRLSIIPVLPENQINQEVKYFDLRMQPQAHQQVVIKLKNHTNQKMNLKISYADTKTTSQGILEYSENKDLKLIAPKDRLFTQLVTGPDEVTLEANGIKEVVLDIQMPEELYDGEILGGVEFFEEIDDQESTSSLMMQRSYLVGFKLSETDVLLPINLELSAITVGMKHYKNAILVSLTNQNARLLDDVTVSLKVINQEEQMAVIDSNQEGIRIAPYSVYEIPIYLEENLLDIGKYQLDLQVEQKSGYQKQWHESFEVTKRIQDIFKETNDLWEKEPQVKEPLRLFFFAIGITVVTLLLIVIVSWVMLKKRGGKKK